MTTIMLQSHAEKLAPEGILAEFNHPRPLLYHQARTYKALEHIPLVMNIYPTGTGKTIAALLHLLDTDQQQRNTLIIAPTNALISQHATEVREFVAYYGLNMRVFEANAAALGALDRQLRPGERLQRFLENPLTFAEQLMLADDAEKQPFVVVTNPDIFYYGIYFQYQHKDQRNVFAKFIANFHYLVIDEFHYYDNKQFANFLLFFALWKQWGYFAHGRSICLLSATPRSNVYTYLNRLFPENAWVIIGPDNEALESAAYATVQTLTELELTIVADQIDSWVAANQAQIESWQHSNFDSVIISSSLGKINDIYALLQKLEPVRITGPESQAARQRVRPIILATPTVDIGYNFGRPGKARQSIDRLVCDARFGDELTQRIGRAGRILGRADTTQASQAFVIVNAEAAAELKVYNGQSLSRAEWATIVGQLQYLPPKHQLDSYIRSYAIMEAFYPLYQLSKLKDDEKQALEEFYQLVHTVFAPTTKSDYITPKIFIETYNRRSRWLKQSPEAKRWLLDEWNKKDLAQNFADYIGWLESHKGRDVRYKGIDFLPVLQRLLLSQPHQKRELLAFIESQVALTKALFNFREAWQAPPVTVFDPYNLFSSETVNQCDLLHLITNYHFALFHDQYTFEKQAGKTIEASLYAEIKAIRSPKLTTGFDYASLMDQAEFEDRYTRRVVSLCGLKLLAKERGLEGKAVMLDENIRKALEQDYIPCLIVSEPSWWVLISILKGTPFYMRDLLIDFPDGISVPYKIITGTAAFHILPALKRHYAMLDKKLSDDAIFL